jgi:hypothetical protein
MNSISTQGAFEMIAEVPFPILAPLEAFFFHFEVN